MDFCVYRRPCLIWSPVTARSTIITHGSVDYTTAVVTRKRFTHEETSVRKVQKPRTKFVCRGASITSKAFRTINEKCGTAVRGGAVRGG